LDRPAKKGSGSWVDIGLKQQAKMDQLVLPLTRVTLKLSNFDDPEAPFYDAEAVSKKVPRMQQGLYWGYDVRIAKNLKDMFNT
jgi:predicted SPOUT superfamily RNA methylase MTH1